MLFVWSRRSEENQSRPTGAGGWSVKGGCEGKVLASEGAGLLATVMHTGDEVAFPGNVFTVSSNKISFLGGLFLTAF